LDRLQEPRAIILYIPVNRRHLSKLSSITVAKILFNMILLVLPLLFWQAQFRQVDPDKPSFSTLFVTIFIGNVIVRQTLALAETTSLW
jgi:hypothetical protein